MIIGMDQDEIEVGMKVVDREGDWGEVQHIDRGGRIWVWGSGERLWGPYSAGDLEAEKVGE
jgi:hypothetical protein